MASSAMAIAWEALLHPTISLVNQILMSIGLPTANWLRDPATALPALAVIGIWQNLGFSMVMILAGLKSIPEALYDAAAVDGADAWFSRLGLVTLPMLGPVFMFVSIVMALRAFETFDTVQILTQGGPGTSSQVLLYTLYTESFLYMRTGYGAAVTVVFFLIVLSAILRDRLDRFPITVDHFRSNFFGTANATVDQQCETIARQFSVTQLMDCNQTTRRSGWSGSTSSTGSCSPRKT